MFDKMQPRNRALNHASVLYFVALINFIFIIFEIYVHKKLIYFVRREADRKEAKKWSETIVCVYVYEFKVCMCICVHKCVERDILL